MSHRMKGPVDKAATITPDSLDGVPIPVSVAALVEVIGAEAAFKMVEKLGGIRIMVPKSFAARPSEPSSAATRNLENLCGPQAAHALIARFGGRVIPIPACKRWLGRVYLARGASQLWIAMQLKVNPGTVWRWTTPGMQKKREIHFISDPLNEPA